MKKFICYFLTLSMILSFVFPAFAEGEKYASKSADTVTENEKFTITLSVPGEDYKTTKDVDEYIIMLDSSDSNADNYPNMINQIKTIGNKVLKDDGSVKITVMNFSYDDAMLFTVDTKSDLNSIGTTLDAYTRGLYPKFTNIENALNSIADYVKKGNSENVEVIFLSDMHANTTEGSSDGKYSGFDLTHWYTNSNSAEAIANPNFGWDNAYPQASYGAVISNNNIISTKGISSFKLALLCGYLVGVDFFPGVFEEIAGPESSICVAYDNYMYVLSEDGAGLGSADFYNAYYALVDEIVALGQSDIIEVMDAAFEMIYDNADMKYEEGNLYTTSEIFNAFYSYETKMISEAYENNPLPMTFDLSASDSYLTKFASKDYFVCHKYPLKDFIPFKAGKTMTLNNSADVLQWMYDLELAPSCFMYYLINEGPTPGDNMLATDYRLTDGFRLVYRRAIEAAETLAGLESVNELKFLKYYTPLSNGSATKPRTYKAVANGPDLPENLTEIWANPYATLVDHVVSNKISFTQVQDVDAAISTLSNIAINTDMEGAYVEDPMSEYVTLDENSIKIYRDGNVIYQNGAWTITEDIPVASPNVPIEITTMANGLRKIKWRVKDGVIAGDDNYKLTYDVTLNTDAPGYVEGNSYPANGETVLNYTSVRSRAPMTKSLRVPEVGPEYFVDISNAKVGAEYNVYKIFDVTYDGNGGFSYTYTSDTYDTTAETPLDKLISQLEDDGMIDLTPIPGTDNYVVTVGDSNDGTNPTTPETPSDDKTSDYAKALQEYNEGGMFDNMEPEETVVADSNHIIIDVSNYGAGYYFVTTTNGSFVLVDTTDNTAYVQEKTADPTVDKEITNTVGSAKDDDFALGDTVYYDVTVHAKPGAINYKTVDVCPLGLTLDNASIVLKIGNNTLPTTNYTLYVKPATTTSGSIINIGFKQDYLDTITSNTDITISYSGIVNDKAVAGANPNTVTLTWGASSEFSDDATDEFYTAEYKFVKVDQNDHTKTLQGVQFKIYDAATNGTQLGFTLRDGIYYYDKSTSANVLTTDANGIIHLDLLEAGDYYLEEISTLPGYNLPTGRTKISIVKGTAYGIDTAIYVENSSGVELPSTGGIGTKIFIGIGLLAVLAAGVFLLSNKRMSKEDF